MGLRVVQLAVLIALGGFPAAAAATDVIHVDPGSPAGKEYGFPLGQARHEAGVRPSGGAGADQGSLFGVGIRPLAATSSGGSPPTTPHAVGTRHSAHPLAGSERSPARAISSSTTGGADGHVEIALAAAVVLLGGGVGLILRWASQRR